MMNKVKTIRGRPKAKVVFIEEPPLIVEEEMPIEEPIELPEPEPEPDFLAELNNQNYNKCEPTEPEYDEDLDQPEFREEPDDFENINLVFDQEEEPERIQDDEPSQSSVDLINRLREQRNREPAKRTPTRKIKTEDEDEIFSSKGSEILGETRLLLINKITRYKHLFKNELKTFKIKKGATEDELQEYINEMDTIVSIGSIDNFITDSILQTIKVVESISAMSNKYDISGLSEVLKNNPQFSNLTKQIYLKYNTFSKVPPEYQLGLLVITSSYICNLQNKKKKSDFMNQMMPIKQTTI